MYQFAMMVFASAYGRRLGRLPIMTGLIIYAGVLEMLQVLSPGLLPPEDGNVLASSIARPAKLLDCLQYILRGGTKL